MFWWIEQDRIMSGKVEKELSFQSHLPAGPLCLVKLHIITTEIILNSTLLRFVINNLKTKNIRY